MRFLIFIFPYNGPLIGPRDGRVESGHAGGHDVLHLNDETQDSLLAISFS